LVSLCPLHGTVGNLCKLYLNSLDNVTPTVPAKLQPSLALEAPTHTVNRNCTESWIDDCDYYTIKVDICNPRVPNMLPITHTSVKTSCIIDGKPYMCTRYFWHPLYNYCKFYENGIGIVTQSRSNVGPFSINKIKVLSGMTTNVHTKDLPMIDCECAIIYSSEDSTSICYKNKHADYFSIMVMSRTHSNLIQTLQNTYVELSDQHTMLYAKSFQRGWLSHTLSISNTFDKTVVHVGNRVMQGTEDGRFISTHGAPSIVYINAQMCIVIYISSRKSVLFDLNIVDINTQLSGTFKAYVTKDKIYIDRPLCAGSCGLDVITNECASVSEVSRVYSGNWREFVPTCCESIVVRPRNETGIDPDLDTNNMSIILSIFVTCIENMMSDLSWDCIILHGRPSYEFLRLMQKYECHYVYPHDWCDEIGELETFHSMDVFHYGSVKESHTNFVPNSFGIVMSDDGYIELKSHALTIYLPSDQSRAVHRNEFDIYLAIGLPTDVTKPYTSKTIEFRDTNIASVLSSIHVTIPDINLLFHPSIDAYIDIV